MSQKHLICILCPF